MLELQNIHWQLPDGGEILKGISLSIPDGQLTVVTGPNGGGKTSLAKVIAGLYAPSEGKILLNGEDITELSITDRAKKGIAYAFQQPVRFKGLTVLDLLELSAEEKLPRDKVCSLLGEVGLCSKEYINREADSSLSGGESKRIEIASILARQSPLMIFDEPEAGIDLWSFSNLIEAFERLKAEGSRSLLVISHQERIMEIADNIVVIAGGKVRTCGKKDDVLPTLLADEKTERCPMDKAKREVRA